MAPASVVRLELGMASAARHLHGDLYGHNILHNGQGLARACQQEEPGARPLFDEIKERLFALADVA